MALDGQQGAVTFSLERLWNFTAVEASDMWKASVIIKQKKSSLILTYLCFLPSPPEDTLQSSLSLSRVSDNESAILSAGTRLPLWTLRLSMACSVSSVLLLLSINPEVGAVQLERTDSRGLLQVGLSTCTASARLSGGAQHLV